MSSLCATTVSDFSHSYVRQRRNTNEVLDEILHDICVKHSGFATYIECKDIFVAGRTKLAFQPSSAPSLIDGCARSITATRLAVIG